jgi:hypothetical protein
MATYRVGHDEFLIEDYARARPFASFLPGIAGLWGVPMWVFYVNRGQAIAGFGIQDKEHPMMEFLPANRAYRTVPLHGFRTFLKFPGRRGDVYEPFGLTHPKPDDSVVRRRMRIRMHELVLEETHRRLGVETRVQYFTIPNEPIAALARVVSITNRSRTARPLEILDGLPLIIPYGMLDRFLKSMSRTIEAWVTVTNLEQQAPFYRLKAEPHDRPEVVPIRAGNFFTGVATVRDQTIPLRPIIDPSLIFGLREDCVWPEAFAARAFRAPDRQFASEKTPCAMGYLKTTLEAGSTCTLVSFYGHAESQAQLIRLLPTLRDPSFAIRKAQENERLIRELTDAVTTQSGCPTFDLYCRQTFLDNALRGGVPVTFSGPSPSEAPKVLYVYARKHGDLERDYNHFVIPATSFSQGNANYRDVNQNRRSDVWFSPQIGEHNIITFFNLLQADGFNPLVYKGTRYRVSDHLDAAPSLREVLAKSFTPGELLKHIERRHLKLSQSPEELLRQIMPIAHEILDAEHGEGFWIDHWTYNLDMLESYLALYPDRLKRLLLDERAFTFYDNPHVVVPRAQRYRLIQNQVRQLHAVVRDAEKAALIQSRLDEPQVMRTQHGRGPVYVTTLLVKMLCVVVNKVASLDPFGIGVEMEADRPSWYDALNGLPALLGSSACETFELKRWIVFLQRALDRCSVREGSVPLPEELHDFLTDVQTAFPLSEAAYWDRATEAKERYRARVRLGFSGAQREGSFQDLREFLTRALAKVERGIAKAWDATLGIPCSYFAYEVIAHQAPDGAAAAITPTRWQSRALPVFLQGAVHAMRVETDPRRARSLHQAVRRSPLYDATLKMYRICGSLAQEPEAIGRCRVFSPGWLENQSIWLHMEYKYLLELLRQGLYEEFYRDFVEVLIPFQPPKRYARSPLENCSFLVSSVYDDPSLHGAGFVARLSGATAEFLQMWLWMTVGREPFTLNERGELSLRLAPVLSKSLFDAAGRFAFVLLGKIPVTYHNAMRLPTFGPRRAVPRMIRLFPKRGEPIECPHGTIPPPYAAMVRDGAIARIEVELAPEQVAKRSLKRRVAEGVA